MGIIKGGALRIFQSLLYLLEFCCAGIILGIYSYFLAVLSDRHEHIPQWERAVEGMSGAACLYLIFATVLTCCLGGVEFFAFLAMVLDILFCAAMIAIAVLARSGASSCSGYVTTPLGNGQSSDPATGWGGPSANKNYATYEVKLRTACKLNTAVFAVAIIAAILFLITAVMQVALVRNHKKEKRYGPSPANNYTSGTGKRRGMFGRKNNNVDRDTELGAAGVGATAGGLAASHHDTRPSHETGYTGSTVTAPGAATYDKADAHHGHAAHGAHGGYYTQPQGTGVNPYGYDNRTAGTATNY